MTKHIGIVAGSSEGAALCYRTICLEAPAIMGEHNHPEITMNCVPMSEHMPHIIANDWEASAELVLASVRKVAQAGADFAICPDNTYHQAINLIRSHSPIPWLHIAEVVAEEAQRLGYARLGIMGTKYLMTGPVYRRVLAGSPASTSEPGAVAIGLAVGMEIPDAPNRERIDQIIFKELVNGIFNEDSRSYLNEVVDELKQRGCDAVVLGCTELPLIVRPDDCPLPTLDSTRLLARAALRLAID